jgi:hypothetical protein
MNLFYRGVGLVVLLWAAQGFGEDLSGAGYKLQKGDDLTFVSPDKTVRVEQYVKVYRENWFWQFRVVDKGRKHTCLLNANPMPDYSAGFRFSRDSQWLVRMQKTGAGYATLYLYQRHGLDFVEATKKPLGDMAWSYYGSVRKGLKLPEPVDHISADLVKGYEEDYRWLGYQWPPGRYLILTLSGFQEGGSVWCIYDTKEGKFSITPELEAKRAAAQMIRR